MMSVVVRVPETESLVVPLIVKMQIKEKNNTIILPCNSLSDCEYLHVLFASTYFMLHKFCRRTTVYKAKKRKKEKVNILT